MNRRQFFESTLAKFASASAAYIGLRQQLRSMDRSRIKAARLGGDQEAGFEQAFASLAYAYLRDKVPQILDHMVGFQLLDRSEDNKKAVGVFGFLVEPDTWLYAPVFFLGGDLKGHELLYVQNKDAFVPLSEEWVNYILSRQPHILGKPSVANISTLGGLQPSIYPLKVPPRYAKYGSAHDQSPPLPEWLNGFLPILGATALQTDKLWAKFAGLSERMDLGHALRQSVTLLRHTHRLAEEYPAIKLGIDRFYGKDFFHKTASAMLETERVQAQSLVLSPGTAARRPSVSKMAGLFEQPLDPLVSGQLQLIEKQADKLRLNEDELVTQNLPVDVTDAEREKLMRDSVLIRDSREAKSVTQAYNVQIPMSLNNPINSAIYPILVDKGKFERFLVLTAPYSHKGTNAFLTLVRLEGDGEGKTSQNADTSYVWAKQQEEDSDFRKWWEALPEGSLEEDGEYVAVGERGQGTVPFTVRQKRSDDVYEVSFHSHADKCRPGYMPRLFGRENSTRPDAYGEYSEYPHLVRINQRPGTSFKALAGELFIPREYKLLKLRRPRKPNEDSESYSKSHPEPISLGNLADQQMQLFQKMALLKASLDGPHVILNFGHHRSPGRFTKQSALFELVGQHGLKEAAAQEILTQLAPGKTVQFRLSYAPWYAEKQAFRPQGGFLSDVGQMAPAQPAEQRGTENYITTSAQGQYPYEETMPVPALDSSQTDPSVYDPYRAHYPGPLETAQQAAQSGQKEVFDTSVLSSLLNTVNEDKLFSEGIGDLIKAIDRLGRLRFSMLWHRDEAEQRYGRDALPDIEDGLVNAFDSLGQITLELKEKEVNPQIDLPSTHESLSAISEN